MLTCSVMNKSEPWETGRKGLAAQTLSVHVPGEHLSKCMFGVCLMGNKDSPHIDCCFHNVEQIERKLRKAEKW